MIWGGKRRMCIFLTTAVVMCSITGVKGQGIRDSIRNALNTKPSIIVGFDGRNTIVSDYSNTIFGIMYGWDYGKIAVYTGVYVMKPFRLYNIQGTDTLSVSYDFSYISSTLEYDFFVNKRWRLSVPVQLGIGYGHRVNYHFNEPVRVSNPLLIPVEARFNAIYKATRYLGLGAGLGLRKSLINSSRFDGPVYSFGLVFRWGNIWKDFKKAVSKD